MKCPECRSDDVDLLKKRQVYGRSWSEWACLSCGELFAAPDGGQDGSASPGPQMPTEGL